jgi:hypothetical protein
VVLKNAEKGKLLIANTIKQKREAAAALIHVLAA